MLLDTQDRGLMSACPFHHRKEGSGAREDGTGEATARTWGNVWLSNTTVGLTSSNLPQVLMVGTHQPGAASARPVSDTNRGIRSAESEVMK